MSNMLAPLQQPIQLAKGALYALPAPPALRSFMEMAIRVVRNFSRDDGAHMAAGLAYYATFSIFPLVLGIIAVSGFFLDTAEIRDEILKFLDEQLPGIGDKELIRNNITALVDSRGAPGVVAIVALFWSSRAMFGAIHRVLNRAWHTHDQPHFLLYQLGQVGAAAAIGVVFFGTTAMGTIGRAITADANTFFGAEFPGGPLLYVLHLAISVSLFAFIYRFVPDAEVRWRDAILGAAFASSMLELAKSAFAYYLGNLSSLDLVYGSVTTMVALMLFLYIVAILLVLGAEISSEYNSSSRAGLITLRGRLRPVRGGLAPAADR